MTINHINLVRGAAGLTGNQVNLLCAMANRTDDHGYCWPSITRLSDETSLSEATVKRTRKQLEQVGLLLSKRRTTKAGDPTSNLYRINTDKLRSIQRPARDYGDDMVGELIFPDEGAQSSCDQLIDHSDPTSKPEPTAEALSRGHSEPTPGHTDPTSGHSEPTPGHSELQTLSKPSIEPPPNPPAVAPESPAPAEPTPLGNDQPGKTPRDETALTQDLLRFAAGPSTDSTKDAENVLVAAGQKDQRLSLSARDRVRLTPDVNRMLGTFDDRGYRWTPEALVSALVQNLPETVNSPYGLVRKRLNEKRPTLVPDVPRFQRADLPWCGQCDEDRMVEHRDPEGELRLGHCHDCNPRGVEQRILRERRQTQPA